MIRSELCQIAGITAPTFNSHRRNGDLPFDPSPAEAVDGAGRTWSRFSLVHAALLIAARQLAAAQGVTWSEAAATLRATGILCGPTGFEDRFFNRAGIHVARVEFAQAATNDAPSLMDRTQTYKGPLADILRAAEAAAAGYSKRHPDQPVIVASIASVDLSHCWNIAVKAADMLGIDPGPMEGQPDPEDWE